MRKLFILPVICAVLFLSGLSAHAFVKLPSIIGDNMMLQQGRSAPVWGWADPGERVTVSIGSQEVSATANEDGKWKVNLEPMHAGGPYTMTISGDQSSQITLSNILIGEVWVCSGQSNMQWTVSNSANPEKEIAAADYPKIRLFYVKRTVAADPQEDCEGQWEECSPETIPGFSAVAYFFGRELHKDLDTPIGLIHTSWGGTPAESWTSLPTLEAYDDFHPILNRFGNAYLNYPAAMKRFEKQTEEWKKAQAEGKKDVRRPYAPLGPEHPHRPAGLYNGMIMPLVPYAIAGAIWYQGESNAGRAYQYRSLFPTMIRDWRETWGQGDFPFLFVQLANFREVKPEPEEDDWAELREAQTMTLALPNTGMAVIIDIGEADDIHPKNKQDVGRRLALAGEAIAYGRTIEYSGPMYKAMTIDDNKARISFTHTGSGLTVKDGGALKGFSIAGPDRKFVWADAVIEGNEVVVKNGRVENPIAVRYGWAINPVCNLFNKDGLPASPFRTDNWPGNTFDKR